MTEPTVWTRLSHDPRVGEQASLRASDADRGVVQALLSDAYADGRLTSAEHDERTTSLWHAVTLGDLRDLIADLVPAGRPRTAPLPPPAPSATLTARTRGRRSLRWRLAAFLVPSIVCVLLWRFASPGLFWPAWVIVYTGLPLLRRR